MFYPYLTGSKLLGNLLLSLPTLAPIPLQVCNEPARMFMSDPSTRSIGWSEAVDSWCWWRRRWFQPHTTSLHDFIQSSVGHATVSHRKPTDAALRPARLVLEPCVLRSVWPQLSYPCRSCPRIGEGWVMAKRQTLFPVRWPCTQVPPAEAYHTIRSDLAPVRWGVEGATLSSSWRAGSDGTGECLGGEHDTGRCDQSKGLMRAW